MTTTLQTTHLPDRPVPSQLSVVGKARRTRPPLSATLALFAAGMTPGFLLASVASAQGSAGIVDTELLLAGAAAVTALTAATRARHIQRQRQQRIRQRAAMRPTAPTPIPMRRAA